MMHNFDEYTLIVFQTAKEYHEDIPEQKYCAHLKEISPSRLRAYGSNLEAAISYLKEQFIELCEELTVKGRKLPDPSSRLISDYSGKIVLRMPSWLHRQISEYSDEQDISINSYIVNELIQKTTIDSISRINLVNHKDLINKIVGYQIASQKMSRDINSAPISFAKLTSTAPANIYQFQKTGTDNE